MRRFLLDMELRSLGFADDLLLDRYDEGVDLRREPDAFPAVAQDLEQVRPLDSVLGSPIALADSGASTRGLEPGLTR